MSSQQAIYDFHSIGDVLSRPDPVWLIEGLLIKGTFAVLFGPPGVGKSFLALAWAFAIANGKAWFGREVKPGPVVYLAAEGFGGLKLRVAALLIDGDYKKDAPCKVVDRPVNFLESDPLKAFIKGVQDSVGEPVLIVIDTLARCFVGGDENSAKDMGKFIDGVETLRRETGSAVLVIHHEGKVQGRGLRGSSALEGAADTVIRAEAAKSKKPKDDDNSDGSESANGLGVVTLTCGKQKDAVEFKKCNLIGRRVNLDGGGSSCVFDSFDDMVAGIMSPANDPTTKKILAVLKEKFGVEGATATAWQRACEAEGISRETFYRRRKEMDGEGLVVKEGEGQGARYRVAKSEPEAVSVSADVKPMS
jgi:hypothetical protein